MTFAQEDQRHLEAASGYVQLGMYFDANEELEQITPELRVLPQVLAQRLQIYRAWKKWALMQVVAKQLVRQEPENPLWWLDWSRATYNCESTNAARSILEKALETHPNEARFLYTLGQYECELGNCAKAKARLEKAFTLDPKCRLSALEDEKLEPLWTSM